jgi:hypothetical protein
VAPGARADTNDVDALTRAGMDLKKAPTTIAEFFAKWQIVRSKLSLASMDSTMWPRGPACSMNRARCHDNMPNITHPAVIRLRLRRIMLLGDLHFTLTTEFGAIYLGPVLS